MGDSKKYKIIIDDVKPDNIKPILQEGLRNFNFPFFGPYELQKVAIYINNSVSEVIAGVYGFIMQKHKTMRLELVWVHEDYRNCGIGTKLFKKIEEYALSKKCEFIQVSTMEFQGNGFYQKMGYCLIATVPKWFCDRDELFFIKVI
jgi:GNAT superfamily N-acetyltransferase